MINLSKILAIVNGYAAIDVAFKNYLFMTTVSGGIMTIQYKDLTIYNQGKYIKVTGAFFVNELLFFYGGSTLAGLTVNFPFKMGFINYVGVLNC